MTSYKQKLTQPSLSQHDATRGPLFLVRALLMIAAIIVVGCMTTGCGALSSSYSPSTPTFANADNALSQATIDVANTGHISANTKSALEQDLLGDQFGLIWSGSQSTNGQALLADAALIYGFLSASAPSLTITC